jgi:hypothetical protein
MDKIKFRMEDEAREAGNTLNLDDKALKLETTPQHGFHFRVTLKVQLHILIRVLLFEKINTS